MYWFTVLASLHVLAGGLLHVPQDPPQPSSPHSCPREPHVAGVHPPASSDASTPLSVGAPVSLPISSGPVSRSSPASSDPVPRSRERLPVSR